MKLENQVISLEIAKKLQKLGIRQESLFYWCKHWDAYKGEYVCDLFYQKDEDDRVNPYISAFTVAELGALLPPLLKLPEFVGEKKKVLQTLQVSTWHGRIGFKLYYRHVKGHGASKIVIDNTESNARGKMLIYLMENKLI